MFKPFVNGVESCQIGQLTLENQTDCVSLYGSLQLQLDQNSLEQALALQCVLNQVVLHLQQLEQQQQLPKTANPTLQHWVDNPFLSAK